VKLELPFQVVATVSGLLKSEESKKYELQVYFPHSDTFREVSSCSNSTDYLSRNLGIRYGSKKVVNFYQLLLIVIDGNHNEEICTYGEQQSVQSSENDMCYFGKSSN
jgi:seryl-tRNA synthetase